MGDGFREGLFRALLCGATLAMLGLSWRLWVDGGTFPRVPFVAGLVGPATGPLFGLLIASTAAGVVWRRALAGVAVLPMAWSDRPGPASVPALGLPVSG